MKPKRWEKTAKKGEEEAEGGAEDCVIEKERPGRKIKEEGTAKELETLKRRREMYQEGKEEKKPRGRPKTLPDTDALQTKRENDRRYRQRKKEKLLKVAMFPSRAEEDRTPSTPTPILRSPSRVSVKFSVDKQFTYAFSI